MKFIRMIVAALVCAAVGAPALCEEAPTTQPAPAAVAATVGGAKIMVADIEAVLADAPADMPKERLAMVRQRVLDQMIQAELIKAHLKTLPAAPEQLAAMKKEMTEGLKAYGMTVEQFMAARGITEEMLADQAKLKKVQEAALSDEKVAAVVKAKPVACFDGTEVQASHILLMCPLYATEVEAAAVKARLEAIAKEVKDGKVTFADAAKKDSACPSSEKGGDLGAFTYGKMVPAFAEVAFAMKVDEVSGVVRTSFGFHLIKVTKRTAGSGKNGDDASEIAKAVLASQIQDEIIIASAKANPVKIVKP